MNLLLGASVALEASVFLASVYGVKKLTDKAVERFGPEVEGNRRMKEMYEETHFQSFWLTMGWSMTAFLMLGAVGYYQVFGLGWVGPVVGLVLALPAVLDLLYDVRFALRVGLWRPKPSAIS